MSIHKDRQIGQFSISHEAIERYGMELFIPLFAQMFIIRAEFNYGAGTFEYVAYSPMFESVQEGMVPYFYGITATHKRDGSVSFECSKVGGGGPMCWIGEWEEEEK